MAGGHAPSNKTQLVIPERPLRACGKLPDCLPPPAGRRVAYNLLLLPYKSLPFLFMTFMARCSVPNFGSLPLARKGPLITFPIKLLSPSLPTL